MSTEAYSYENQTGTGIRLGIAALLAISATNMAYADEVSTANELPYALVKIIGSSDFNMDLIPFSNDTSMINEYNILENKEYAQDINGEMLLDLKMPPIKRHKRKVKITKRIHATPRINIPELV